MNLSRITRGVAPAVIVGLYAVLILTAVQTTHHGIALGGAPLFYDFEAFYEAGRFALHGDAAAAYDDLRMIAAEKAAFPGMTVKLPWNYPPTLQLLMAPLAALPYVPSWFIWSIAGYAAFVATLLRPSSGHPPALMLLAPAAAVNLFFGQNGLFTVALIVGGVGLLDRKPWLAGALLGMLAYKPQMAVLAPLLLVAGGHWRALGSAIASQAALAVASVLVLGLDPWMGFVGKLLHPAGVVASSSSDWRAVPSMMVLGRSLGLDPTMASGLHWTVALLSVAVAVWVWRSSKEPAIRAATAGAATALISPYLRAYDLAVLAPAAAWLAMGPATPRRLVQRIAEWVAAVLAWMAPALLMFFTAPMQYGALISLAALLLLAWRLQSAPQPVGIPLGM